MTSGTTEVLGADQLARSLDDVAGGLDQMADAAGRAGDLVRVRAAALAPVNTGLLARSIQATVEGSNAVITAAAPYAIYQEYGTAIMPASPYLRPALDSVTGPVVEVYAQGIQSMLDNVKGA